MTTPAVNISESSNGPVKLEMWDVSSGTWYVLSDGSALSFDMTRQRPESVNNPIRPDRTRGPSAFWHKGGLGYGINGEVQVESYGTLYRLTGYVSPPPSHTWIDEHLLPDPALVDKSMLNALLKVKDSKVNLGVALAEARKTAELVARNADTIGRQIDSFMEKNWRKVGRMASWKKLPAKYLELSYGWTPLLNDVVGSAEALSKLHENGSLLSLDVSGFAREATEGRCISGIRYVGPPIEYIFSGKSLYQTKLVYQIPTNLLSEFSSLGLTNPAEIGWELLPYSFVIDWFLPIGDWLSALDAGFLLEFKEGSQSYIGRTECSSWEPIQDDSGFTELVSYRVRRPVGRGFKFLRNLTYPYQPMLPSLRAPLSLDKMAKGLSLLTQVLKKWS